MPSFQPSHRSLKPDSGKVCADGEKLLTKRQLGESFEVTAQPDVP